MTVVHGPWTREEEIRLIEIYEKGRGAAAEAAQVLGRSEAAIQTHMSRLKTDLNLTYALRRRAQAIRIPKGPASKTERSS